MSLSSVSSSFSNSFAVARALGGGLSGQAVLFVTLASIPFRKKLFGSRAIPFWITRRGTRVQLYARDSADIAVLRDVFIDGEYSLALPREPRHIVDIGGHAGYVSVFFALTYPKAEIRVFEPDPGNFATLLLNTRAFPNIRATQAAVSTSSGTATFYSSDSSISSSLKSRAGMKATTVETVALDDILSRQPADLVKFDIEGTEYELFAGSKLAVAIPFYVGEMHYDLIGHTPAEFLSFFSGYTAQERRIAPQRTILTLVRRD